MTGPLPDKTTEVGSMFDRIAFRYDFLNHFLSFGTDRLWRKKVIRIISSNYKNPLILDVATGTADLAITSIQADPKHVTGIDISPAMLEIGRIKISKMGLSDKIDLNEGSSENILYGENTFDVVMVAFGVRNFNDPVKGLSEMYRVLRPGGMVLVLEFSKPQSFPFRHLYYFYFRFILPVIGRMISGDRAAYRYLHDSVMQFPDNEEFIGLMEKAGFPGCRQKKLSGGIASIYSGFKPSVQ